MTTKTKIKSMGDVLAEAREKSGLTQREIAKKMGYSGSQIVSNWERGLCGIPAKKAATFCKLTGMKISDMEKLLSSAAVMKIGKQLL